MTNLHELRLAVFEAMAAARDNGYEPDPDLDQEAISICDYDADVERLTADMELRDRVRVVRGFVEEWLRINSVGKSTLLRRVWWEIRGVGLNDYRTLCRRCMRTGQTHFSPRSLFYCRRFQRPLQRRY